MVSHLENAPTVRICLNSRIRGSTPRIYYSVQGTAYISMASEGGDFSLNGKCLGITRSDRLGYCITTRVAFTCDTTPFLSATNSVTLVASKKLPL